MKSGWHRRVHSQGLVDATIDEFAIVGLLVVEVAVRAEERCNPEASKAS